MHARNVQAAAKSRNGRYAHRDATMILIAYGHSLRASELIEQSEYNALRSACGSRARP